MEVISMDINTRKFRHPLSSRAPSSAGPRKLQRFIWCVLPSGRYFQHLKQHTLL